MIKKLHVCFTLSICIILFMPGIAASEENKKDLKSNGSGKTQTEKMIKNQPLPVFPWTDNKYSMRILIPNPHLDPEIVKNTFDPGIDYKLRIIDPYTRKEITGNKGPCPGLLHRKFLQK